MTPDIANIFISYSHKSNGPRWKSDLLRYLSVLTDLRLIEAWDDEHIQGGYRWEKEIDAAIHRAHLAIVLLTQEALDSEFILKRELLPLSYREANEGLIVVPILCEPCEWSSHPWLQRIQIRPFGAKPLGLLAEFDQQRIFRELASEVAMELGRSALRTFVASTPVLLPQPIVPLRVDTSFLPLTRTLSLQGREQELALLDLAYADQKTSVLTIVAWGGTGKTSLVRTWVNRMNALRWPLATHVYAWSFYRQGTTEDSQTTDEFFLNHACDWFGITFKENVSSRERGRQLAERIVTLRCVLILDGIESLQYSAGPLASRLLPEGILELLSRVASTPNHSLCVLTSRDSLADLQDFRRATSSDFGAVELVLGPLPREAGAAVLYRSGCNREGTRQLTDTDDVLMQMSDEVGGHALTLSLLGKYLSIAHGGDVMRRDLIEFQQADSKTQGGHAFRVLAAYEQWLSASGSDGESVLSFLKSLSIFDGPADSASLNALFAGENLTGITDSIAGEDVAVFNEVISRLMELELVSAEAFEGPVLRGFSESEVAQFERAVVSFYSGRQTNLKEVVGEVLAVALANRPKDVIRWNVSSGPLNRWMLLSCHPLIRDYFHRRITQESPDSVIEAHRRIAAFLQKNIPFWPDDKIGIQLLYKAVYHECKAGNISQAYQIRRCRLDRGAGYTQYHLKLNDTNVLNLRFFFSPPWSIPRTGLTTYQEGHCSNSAAISLRAVGRLDEAALAIQLAIRVAQRPETAADAFQALFHLATIRISQGDLTSAEVAANECRDWAVRSRAWQAIEDSKAIQGAIAHFRGEFRQAKSLFAEAEETHKKSQPWAPTLYGAVGAMYCDFLLREAERVAWQLVLGQPSDLRVSMTKYGTRGLTEVAARLKNMLEWRVPTDTTVDRANEQIVNAKYCLLQGVLTASRNQEWMQEAQSALRESLETSRGSDISDLGLGLILSGEFHAYAGDRGTGKADFDEALRICRRGDMKLLMADVFLSRSRLFYRDRPYPWESSPQADLAEAHRLIEKHGYGRRVPELEDAEVAINEPHRFQEYLAEVWKRDEDARAADEAQQRQEAIDTRESQRDVIRMQNQTIKEKEKKEKQKRKDAQRKRKRNR